MNTTFFHILFPIVTKVASYNRCNTTSATLFSHENPTDTVHQSQHATSVVVKKKL